MIKVRRGVFETNSSSTHSLTMCSRKEYDEWRRGERVYDSCDEKLVLIEKLSEEERETIDEEDFYTYERYSRVFGSDYETFESKYHTDMGEEVISFGYWGYN